MLQPDVLLEPALVNSIPPRAVLTLAVGRPIYFELAVNLARSFLLWHSDGDLPFYIATDHTTPFPPDLASVRRIVLRPGQFGTMFSPKLHLDRIAPAEETLFVDGDCLCMRNLNQVFARFRHCHVGVIGETRAVGEHFGDIGDRCRRLGLPWVPIFVGGLYYIRRGKVADDVFSRARELEAKYDALGFVRLRGAANEEPLIAVGMGAHNQEPLADDGEVKADAMFFRNPPDMDIFRGHAHFTGGGVRPSRQWSIYTPEEARPAVAHFNASFSERPPYTSEVTRLGKVCASHWPVAAATAFARLTIDGPHHVGDSARQLLRPVYRALFGTRPVRQSSRI